jgi:hypothetical protein
VNQDKAVILERLKTGSEVLQAAVAACPATIASSRPDPNRWSILECLEHVVLAEEYLLSQLDAGTPVAPFSNEAREVRILAAGADRSRRTSAPDISHPRGRWNSIPDVITAWLTARARTTAFVESFEGDLRGWQVTHPIVGILNGYELLLMIAIHPLRHAQQIDEIRSSLSLE